MKEVIKLTESDLVKIVKKTINEITDERKEKLFSGIRKILNAEGYFDSWGHLHGDGFISETAYDIRVIYKPEHISIDEISEIKRCIINLKIKMFIKEMDSDELEYTKIDPDEVDLTVLEDLNFDLAKLLEGYFPKINFAFNFIY